MNFAPDSLPDSLIPDSISYEALFYFWLNRVFHDFEAERQQELSE
jgi:hypothetical protein